MDKENTVALGIDTGGTYTDAALIDRDSGAVLVGRKALTTHHDLSVGVGNAVSEVLRDGQGLSASDVELVGLSTTLATNAIVEGQGGRVCLLLIGYDPGLIHQYGFERDLVTDDVVYLEGGHNVEGEEVAPLDENGARQAILARRGQLDAFAVSGYFGVRNPTHELRVKALIGELIPPSDDGVPFPVTCGHELTTRLNAVRRATTVALNARLIPLLQGLIVRTRHTLDALGIAAPLMIVKGDGSLVRAEWAMDRPIETILSGPAASVVGAWHLAGRRDVWVVDVGGTTTDIAVLRDGHPRLNQEGAQVGGWRTMVEAVDVHTVGLGGDSEVYSSDHGGPAGLTIGPRRVVPLCLLASQHPQILEDLRYQTQMSDHRDLAARFAVARGREMPALSEREREIVQRLEEGPQSLLSLTQESTYRTLVVRRVEELGARRVVLQAGFTPTDALHVLGRFELWEREASRLGAEILAPQFDLSPREFCERVAVGVSERVATELVTKALNDEGTPPDWEQEPAATELLARALEKGPDSDLSCRLTLRQPVVAVGAPVEAYMPRVVEYLHTELVIPDHAEVANAVGAVAGGVVQRLRVLIRPERAEEFYRVHLPDGFRDFLTLEEAVAHAQAVAPEEVKARARRAGAEQIEIRVEREDHIACVGGGRAQKVYLGTDLSFVAVGRPSLVRDEPDADGKSQGEE